MSTESPSNCEGRCYESGFGKEWTLLRRNSRPSLAVDFSFEAFLSFCEHFVGHVCMCGILAAYNQRGIDLPQLSLLRHVRLNLSGLSTIQQLLQKRRHPSAFLSQARTKNHLPPTSSSACRRLHPFLYIFLLQRDNSVPRTAWGSMIEITVFVVTLLNTRFESALVDVLLEGCFSLPVRSTWEENSSTSSKDASYVWMMSTFGLVSKALSARGAFHDRTLDLVRGGLLERRGVEGLQTRVNRLEERERRGVGRNLLQLCVLLPARSTKMFADVHANAIMCSAVCPGASGVERAVVGLISGPQPGIFRGRRAAAKVQLHELAASWNVSTFGPTSWPGCDEGGSDWVTYIATAFSSKSSLYQAQTTLSFVFYQEAISLGDCTWMADGATR
ncbi:hypothetical protein BJY52DRAFT_1226821 [Lactarius psammicola]|nr:hypothetical protein BJY52DRAFT_1226821 [Lactarius psammicola]